MADQKFSRRLVGIMFSDIAGFTSIMQVDEAKGRKRVQRYRQVLGDKVLEYQGEILQHYGDGSLSIFPSSILAVNCARDIQLELQKGETVPLRIGINVGDILVEGDEVYGEGINLASRVESLGVPGAVLFTSRVMRDLQSHPDIKTASLGRFHFKNVAAPTHVYALANPGLVVPKRRKLSGKLAPSHYRNRELKILAVALGLAVILLASFLYYSFINSERNLTSTDAPISVAVLPFRNLSPDESLQYFSDGMVEVLRNFLSRTNKFVVTSMTSVQQYRDTEKNLSEIVKELGVQYIIEGSVYRDSHRVRISVQLIEGATDAHIWVRDYERPIQNSMRIHEELAMDITTALKVEFKPDESVVLGLELTNNDEAFDHYLQGMHFLTDYTGESNDQSIEKFKQAITLDGDFSAAKAGLAQAYFARCRRYGGPFSWVDTAYEIAREVVLTDPALPEGHFALSLAYAAKGKREQALDHLLRTVERDPNYPPAVTNIGVQYYHRGALYEAIRWYKKALQVSPHAYGVRSNLGSCYGYLGKFEIAQEWFYEARDINPRASQALIGLMHLYLANSKDDEALNLEQEFLLLAQNNPAFFPYLGELHRMLGNWDEAQHYFQTAIDSNDLLRNEPFAISPIGLAFCLMKEGKVDQANTLLRNVLQAKLAFIEEGGTDKWIFSDIAAIHAIRGETQLCVEWLEKAVDAGWRDVHYAVRDPYFGDMLNEEDFQAIINRVHELIEGMKRSLQSSDQLVHLD